MTASSDLWTVADVATRLHLNPYHVRRLASSGELRASKPNKRWLFQPEDVEDYINEHANKPPARRRRRRAA